MDISSPTALGVDVNVDELAPTSHVRLGASVGNKFRINRVLGEGGMGLVVHATHLQLDEPMALKFLRQDLLSVPGIVERFVQEARAASKLRSEHAVRVFDVGYTEENLPYLVMEYLEGADLGQVLDERGPFSVEEAVRCTLEVCDALAEAHALGIVHRDVKSENLFLTTRPGLPPRIKVLDFGLSKYGLTHDARSFDSPSAPATAMGSPSYMSPEQLRSTRDVDRRADIWSLGVVLYELVANDLPFDPSLHFEAISSAILRDAPRPLAALAPHVPRELEQVILRCLEKEPGLRYQSVADLAYALLPFAANEMRALVARIIEGSSRKSDSEAPHATVAIPKSERTHVSSHRRAAAPLDATPVLADAPAVVRELTERLALRVGPFARVFVQKELRARGDSPKLTAHAVEDMAIRLATKIPLASDRRSFLREAEELVGRRR